MSARLSDLGENTEVVLVTFSNRERLDGYRAANDLPFPIMIDPDRSAYRAFGLGRGSVSRVYGWKTIRRYIEILRSGGPGRSTGLRELVRPPEDPLQLGGDFVVSADGLLAYGFWSEGPDDRPSVDELVAAVRAIESL